MPPGFLGGQIASGRQSALLWGKMLDGPDNDLFNRNRHLQLESTGLGRSPDLVLGTHTRLFGVAGGHGAAQREQTPPRSAGWWRCWWQEMGPAHLVGSPACRRGPRARAQRTSGEPSQPPGCGSLKLSGLSSIP